MAQMRCLPGAQMRAQAEATRCRGAPHFADAFLDACLFHQFGLSTRAVFGYCSPQCLVGCHEH